MRQVARPLDAIELLRLAFDRQPKLSFSQKNVVQISRAENRHPRLIDDAKQRLAAAQAPMEQVIAGIAIKPVNRDMIHGQARSAKSDSALQVPESRINVV